eukprot:2068077-Amphidinium_carterae.1
METLLEIILTLAISLSLMVVCFPMGCEPTLEMRGYQPITCIAVDWVARMAITAGSEQGIQ